MNGEVAVADADIRVGQRSHVDTARDTAAVMSLPGVRVVHVGPALSVKGGVSSVERLIMSELTRETDAVHIATMSDGGALAKVATFVTGLRRLNRELAAHGRNTIVHVHFASRGSTWRKLVCARRALAAGARLVLHAHGGGFDQFLRQQSPRAQRLIRDTFQRAHLFIVLSSHWRDFYRERLGIDPGRIHILWNPTKMPLDVPDRRGRERVHFVYLGLVSRTKGAFDLIEAVQRLPPEVQRRVQVTVAGNGELDRLRAAAAKLEATIEVRSWITESERDELLRQADVFVLPSYFEGVPMSILEAMAAGIPVISTRVGGIPEIVEQEATGVLIEAGDIAALAAQIERLATNEPMRLQWGEAARRSAERFDVRRYGRELITHYRTLIAGN